MYKSLRNIKSLNWSHRMNVRPRQECSWRVWYHDHRVGYDAQGHSLLSLDPVVKVAKSAKPQNFSH